MSKLKALLEEIELHDKSIDDMIDILSKCKSRLDGILDEPGPNDDKETLIKLKEISDSLGISVGILSDIKGSDTDGE